MGRKYSTVCRNADRYISIRKRSLFLTYLSIELTDLCISTVTDFINLILYYYNHSSYDAALEEIEQLQISALRGTLDSQQSNYRTPSYSPPRASTSRHGKQYGPPTTKEHLHSSDAEFV